MDYATVRRYDPARAPWRDIHRADLNIYHIGNQADFHGAIWQMSRACPGLIVLHDTSLHHLFGGLYRDKWKARTAYLSAMRHYYGETSLKHAAAFFDYELSTEFMAEHFPLTAHALETALGVVVHSHEAFTAATEASHLPCAHIPMAYPPRENVERISTARADDTVGVVMFGFIGKNRRLEPILRAIADLSRRDQLRLDICGEVYDDETEGLINTLGLDKIVRLHGFLSDEELDGILAQANLALNLRYPSMGEASLSQMRIWEHALPTMVTRVGWYAALPEDAVCFVRPRHEREDIQRHLNALLDDPSRFKQMGDHGRMCLEMNHSPANYGRTLSEFAASIVDASTFSIDFWAGRVADIARDWFRDDVDPAIFANSSRQILTASGHE
jgi:glycosyltransferase involved in cell wall biosynthesis